MSRSYRYDPDGEAAGGRPSWERGRGGSEPEMPPEPPSRGADDALTPEQAVRRMKRRVRHVVEMLVCEDAIARSEREDYASIINAHICRVLPFYDPDREAEDGGKSSLVHYLHVAVDYAASNIRKMSRRLKRRGIACPIASPDDEGRVAPGSVSTEDACLSDGCRSVRDLWFRMDAGTLFEMMVREERLCVKMRLDGYSNTEVAEEISRRFGTAVDRLHVERTLLKHIQDKARKCGFFPPSELRGEKPEATAHFPMNSCIDNQCPGEEAAWLTKERE